MEKAKYNEIEREKEEVNNSSVSFSALRKDVVNVLDFMERLKNEEDQIAVDVADQIENLKFVLAFICTYIQLSYSNLEKFEAQMNAARPEVKDLLRSILDDVDSNIGCKYNYMNHTLPSLANNMDDCIGSSQRSKSSATTILLNKSRVFKLAHLRMKITPTELEVMKICLTNLKASTSTEVGRFIKKLLEISPDILRKYLIHLQEHMTNVTTTSTSGDQNIHVMIQFLLIILSDMPKDFIHHDKLFDLLARVGELTREVSTLVRDLEEKSRNKESTDETNRATLDLQENIELLKKDLKHVYLKAPDSSQCCLHGVMETFKHILYIR